jgi:tRNA modification GTPase
LVEPQGNRIYFGHWREINGEEVVVVFRALEGQGATIEIHGHGGLAAPQAILDDLGSLGCTVVPWQQVVQSESPDDIAAAARLALAEAATTRTAAILLDQYRGALSQAFADIDQLLAQHNVTATALARQKLARLRELVPLGGHLTSPWKVVLAGKPNVGKSSLMNCLVGYERSIVFNQPGTTRDVLSASTSLDGWPVRLIDCAGLGESADPIEREGVLRARRELATADLVLLVTDAREPLSSEIQAMLAGRPDSILVANKIDLLAGVQPPPAPAGTLWVGTSAITGQGIDSLMANIVSQLVPHPPTPGEAVPFTAEHFQRLNATEANR